jgi:hypothetical protein
MSFPESPSERRTLVSAILTSLILHGLALIIPHHPPVSGATTRPAIQASLAKPTQPSKPPEEVVPISPPPPTKATSPIQTSKKPPPRKPVIALDKAQGKAQRPTAKQRPSWSVAERREMDSFLDELADRAKVPPQPQPTLAERARAMARVDAQQQTSQESSAIAALERRPNSADPDPFSLGLYLDNVLKQLNRNSAFVKNDPRSRGVRKAAVQFRLNPDGTLKSFVVLNAADQGAEIAFIKSVVERAAPFSPFPPDINRAARSMAVRICILPSSQGGFGFSRAGDGEGC